MNASLLWRAPAPLLLASASATRRDLLTGAGLPVETAPARIDERALEAEGGDISPVELARRLARAKAQEVAARHPGRVVIGADQVLECEGRVFHKPADRAAAHDHLTRLQGRTHALHSAVAILRDGRAEPFVAQDFVETARLAMRPLDAAAIDTYLRLAGPAVTTSVGAYQLEGLGIHLFERVEGDHSTVLGLPLTPLLARLRGLGLLAF
ncbi:nucleoside triphosphate pyrophosphatase [Methylorubrum rhodesianum]|uniref:Nucleoside triphosphate pyrophosphatase n=1 Tax=Methylorubrum rhodesianum TaxID=29427 RepID=A0ABU9Z9R6_9HYPH|nr:MULTISPECIES: nucleoside triphosphate pyrophosphatase [Methylorubrum]MBB5762580.1 septum formation protein [Methylorubrum rhodesianum]MBI1688583.1 septum formation protein Maf [Methylorubrum sp. DB1722]MBK3402374.1 septum formation protein Maf [Methylorubrum rhodesianum]MBY0142477.1 septum formation protein Maf [Methylorubrum populi]